MKNLKKSLNLLRQSFLRLIQFLKGLSFNKKIILTSWLIVLLLTCVFVSFAFSQSVWKLKYEDIFVVFNLGKSDLITVTEEGGVHNLDLFDSYYKTSTKTEKITVSKSDQNKINKELEFEDGKSKLYLYVSSDTNNYCYISADVTAVYYQTPDSTKQATSISILSTQPSPSLDQELDLNKYEYIYPGKYFPSEVPLELGNKRLIGIYPVECSKLSDTKTIQQLITYYKTFVPEVERNNLKTELNKIK